MEFFLNDNYKLLKLINDYQFESDDGSYCPLTQDEMAQKIGCSRMTINSILKKLKNEEYIIQNNKNRRYTLSDKSKKIIIQINKINGGDKCDAKTSC